MIPGIDYIKTVINGTKNRFEKNELKLEEATKKIANAIIAPSIAEVGQTIVVSEIDENGKPTEWESVNLPEQVQSDFLQDSSEESDFVKNRTHFCTKTLLAFAYNRNGTYLFYKTQTGNLYDERLYLIKIGETEFPYLYQDEVFGDSDTSVWADGGGMGYRISDYSGDYNIEIDQNRFGNIPAESIELYELTVNRTLANEFLPIASISRRGTVRVETIDDLSGYTSCVSDSSGTIFSKEYKAANIYSELSISNLKSVYSYDGEHGIFTDSISEDISNSVSLTLPVHSWFIGLDYTNYSQKFILESSDGSTYLIKIKNEAITSCEKIASAGGGGMLIVTASPNEEGMLVASNTSTEIYEAINNGKSAVLLFNGVVLSLNFSNPEASSFIGFVDGNIMFVLVAGGSNIHLMVSNTPLGISCEVGQVFRVSGVDESGLATEWEAVDPFVIQSSTEGSTKQFRITVDDTGTLSATEIT